LTDFAGTGETDASSVFDPGRNLGIDRALPKDAAFPFALGAGIGDDIAAPLTCGTSPGDTEESLLITNLPATVTRAACSSTFPGRGTCAVAFFAGLVPPHADLLLNTEESFLELQREIFAQVGAALHTAAAPSAASEHVAEAEELAEDVAEILEDSGIEAGTLRGGAAKSSMAVSVVHGTLLRVGQHRVGFADLLKPLFRVGVVGIAVGMVLERQFAVGTLEFEVSDAAGHA
jgi:hypothetical protein